MKTKTFLRINGNRHAITMRGATSRRGASRRRTGLAALTMISLLILLLLVLPGCIPGTPAVTGNPTVSGDSDATPEKITLVLDWVVNTNHTGIFVAKELGYYEEAGLEVEIVQAPEMNFIEMVGVDAAQFGICGQEQLLQARVTGQVPVVGIGTILQHNTSGFASPADRGILTPKDFEGKRYSGWGTPLEERFLETLMKKDGGDFSKVDMRMMGATDYFASMETEADFAWIYYGWDGIGAQVRSYPLNFILLQDIDPVLDFYSPLLITNEKTLKSNPSLVRQFLSATAKGYQYTVRQPEEACDLLLRSTPETDRSHALASIRYLSEQFLDQQGDFGGMDPRIWNDFTDWMVRNELIDGKPELSECYTTAFLP
jgi:ABC-type nitrate/sulfonate/bicarbonate transport system substrate-binding protein